MSAVQAWKVKHGLFINKRGVEFVSKDIRKLHRAWQAIKSRCYNPKVRAYPDYGGRGIEMCDRWLHNFQHFMADMGMPPKGLSIGRKDNDGSYEPGNCEWQTCKQQQANTRMTVHVTIGIETKCVAEWARTVGMTATGFAHRLAMNYPPEKLLAPPRKCRK